MTEQAIAMTIVNTSKNEKIDASTTDGAREAGTTQVGNAVASTTTTTNNNNEKSFIEHIMWTRESIGCVPLRLFLLIFGVIVWIFDIVAIADSTMTGLYVGWFSYFTFALIASLIMIPVSFYGVIRDKWFLSRLIGSVGLLKGFYILIMAFLFLVNSVCVLCYICINL